MKKYVLIVAGGKGLRMGTDLPKQFIPFLGKPVLMHTIETFYHWSSSIKIILVLPYEHQEYWRMLCKELSFSIPHSIVEGGETRFDSVKNGLKLINEEGLIAVHDGVRPFVCEDVITRCFKEAKLLGAVIPVVPLVDSIRKKTQNGSFPVDRNDYEAVQTPQVFRSEWIIEAYGNPYKPQFTDDASVIEAIGYKVHTVKGNRENIKITDPLDLLVAEELFNRKNKDK